MGLSMNLQTPLWDPSNFRFNNFMFNNMGSNFFTPIWSSGTSNSSSSSSSKEKTYDEWINRGKDKAEQGEFLKEKYQELAKTRELLAIQTNKIDAIKKGKKSDGRTVVETSKIQDAKFKKDGTIDKEAMKPQKKGFWQKTMSWVSSAGTALANMGKAFIGMDENGKINPLKLLRNVAVTAAAIGACFIPVVGPAIGYGLLAYGVGSGAVGVYKGVKKLNNATSEEEREQARQDICSGAIVGAASAVGMRGLGKAFRVSNTATSTATASTAAARTGFFGKTIQHTSQFTRDITVNAFRGTKAAMSADRALIAAKGGGFGGFRKAYGHKISEAWSGFNSWQKRYDNQYNQMEASVNNRLSTVESQIQEIRTLGSGRNLTPAESQRLALLREERYMLQQNLNELRTNFGATKNKDIYDKLTKDNSATKMQKRIANRKASANPNRVQGKDIPEADLNAFYNRILNEQRSHNKALNELIKLKENTMRTYAKHVDKHTSELSQYIPSPDKHRIWWKPSTWRKNEYQLAIGGRNPGKYMELAGITLTSPASPAALSLSQWTKNYSVPMMSMDLMELTPEQTEEALKQLEQEKQQLEAALKNIEGIEDATKWKQLKAEVQAQQEAAAKAAQEAAAQ